MPQYSSFEQFPSTARTSWLTLVLC